MRTFEFSEGTSNKFWNIELQGKSFTVTYGKIGTKGQTQIKDFADEAKAQKAYDKLIAEKTGKGYAETTPKAAVPVNPMQRALEDALAENPDDLASHSAYADYLMEQGDPRGEFIQTQLALEVEKRPASERKSLQKREAALLEKHQRAWLGDLAAPLLGEEVSDWRKQAGLVNKFRFARGWIDSVELYEISDDRASALLNNPLLRLLRQLTVVEQDYDSQGFSVLVRSPNLGNIRSLTIGPRSDSCHISCELASSLVAKMPRIEELLLYAHGVDVDKLFSMKMPNLRVLHVNHIHNYPLEKLAKNASLANLTELACYPHGLEPGDAGAYITDEGAKAIFHLKHLKSLKHLELRATDFGDGGCKEIVKSGILKRLETLNLEYGAITDEGARTLAGCADLKRLKRLRVVSNYLTPAGVQALQATGVPLEAEPQLSGGAGNEREHLWYGDPE